MQPYTDKAAKKLENERRAQELKDHLYTLATTAKYEDTQIRAVEAWLDREEGKAVQRNVNVNISEVSGLGDNELDTEIARLAGGAGAAGPVIEGETPKRLPPELADF
jgi:hypothetical protein